MGTGSRACTELAASPAAQAELTRPATCLVMSPQTSAAVNKTVKERECERPSLGCTPAPGAGEAQRLSCCTKTPFH